MNIYIFDNKRETSKAAAEKAIKILNDTIVQKGEANFVMATGASQFDFIDYLVSDKTVEWGKTNMFHLDEYIGLKEIHPASFRQYLNERFVSKVNLKTITLIHGDVEDPEEECDILNNILGNRIIDIVFLGIGENGHLAFNDPPADFETKKSFKIVNLDKACRSQQVKEGWFNKIDEVPKRAITMTINQIIKAKNIVCTVPGKRKAQAIKDCLQDANVCNQYPASILKKHDKAYIYLDLESASLLDDCVWLNDNPK